MKRIVKRILINDLVGPDSYHTVKPGECLVSMTDKRTWKVAENDGSRIKLIPYSGGLAYDITSESCSMIFGRIEMPEEANSMIAVP